MFKNKLFLFLIISICICMIGYAQSKDSILQVQDLPYLDLRLAGAWPDGYSTDQTPALDAAVASMSLGDAVTFIVPRGILVHPKNIVGLASSGKTIGVLYHGEDDLPRYFMHNQGPYGVNGEPSNELIYRCTDHSAFSLNSVNRNADGDKLNPDGKPDLTSIIFRQQGIAGTTTRNVFQLATIREPGNGTTTAILDGTYLSLWKWDDSLATPTYTQRVNPIFIEAFNHVDSVDPAKRIGTNLTGHLGFGTNAPFNYRGHFRRADNENVLLLSMATVTDTQAATENGPALVFAVMVASDTRFNYDEVATAAMAIELKHVFPAGSANRIDYLQFVPAKIGDPNASDFGDAIGVGPINTGHSMDGTLLQSRVICNRIEIATGSPSVLSSNVIWASAVGSPEGVIKANIGSMYSRTDGGAGTTLYVKESQNASTTGWVAK